MATAFDFGNTTMYVSALLQGRNWAASERPLAPVVLHLHVYEFHDGGLNLVRPPEFHDFSMNLGHLADPQGLNCIIADILSYTSYNNPDTRYFWEEELTNYAANAGRIAFDAGVQELELTVEIHIRYMARWLLEVEREMAEQAIHFSDEEIGRGEELEVVKYSDVGGEFEQNGCSICLEEFQLEMEVTRIPCKHIFHGGCLLQWLAKSHLCPLCRYEVPI